MGTEVGRHLGADPMITSHRPQQETHKQIASSKRSTDPLAKSFAHSSICIHPNHGPTWRPWRTRHVPLLCMLVVVRLINLFAITDRAALLFAVICCLTFVFLLISLPYNLIVEPLLTGVSFKTMHPVSHMITLSADKYSRKMSCRFQTNYNHPLLVHFSLPKSIRMEPVPFAFPTMSLKELIFDDSNHARHCLSPLMEREIELVSLYFRYL